MIHVVIGTKAQLIKMCPVMRALECAGLPYRFIWTGQHKETTREILDNFGLRPPDLILYDGPDITSIPAMMSWTLRLLWKTWRARSDIFAGDRNGIVLVHGDTFSTLLGALMGRVASLRVGHVEAGLRSFNLLHPFPEELTRLLTFRLAHVFFCPGEWAVNNLRNYRGTKIDTHANTLADALAQAVSTIEHANVAIPVAPYAVVSLHRFENLASKAALERIVSIVERIACHTRLVFIMHKPTERRLRASGLITRLEQSDAIELRPRLDYFSFIKLISHAEFVVSDGGSNQEECHYLGKPVLLLRKATERHEGVGQNCILSCYKEETVEHFLTSYRDLRRPRLSIDPSPSNIIAQACSPYAAPLPTPPALAKQADPR